MCLRGGYISKGNESVLLVMKVIITFVIIGEKGRRRGRGAEASNKG